MWGSRGQGNDVQDQGAHWTDIENDGPRGHVKTEQEIRDSHAAGRRDENRAARGR